MVVPFGNLLQCILAKLILPILLQSKVIYSNGRIFHYHTWSAHFFIVLSFLVFHFKISLSFSFRANVNVTLKAENSKFKKNKLPCFFMQIRMETDDQRGSKKTFFSSQISSKGLHSRVSLIKKIFQHRSKK